MFYNIKCLSSIIMLSFNADIFINRIVFYKNNISIREIVKVQTLLNVNNMYIVRKVLFFSMKYT